MRRRSSWLESNAFVRLISVALAFALWIGVNSNTASTSVAGGGLTTTSAVLANVPMVVLTSPNIVPMTVKPSRVDVGLAGSVLDVAMVQAQSGGLRVVANAMHMGPGIHEIHTAVENPPTSAVQYTVKPSVAVVALAEKVTSYMTPEVRLSGTATLGDRFGKPAADVSRVAVTGPEPLVKRVTGVVARMDVNGAQNTVVRTLPLLPVDRSGGTVSGVVCKPAVATVTVPVIQRMRRIPLVISTSGTPAQGYVVGSIQVSPSYVLAGGLSKQAAIVPAIALPPVNVSNWNASHTMLLTVPAPFAGARLNTPVATVTVNVEKGVTELMNQMPVQLTGRQKGWKYEVVGPDTVSIQILGPVSEMGDLQSQYVQAYVNVSGVKSGAVARLPVSVSLPNFMQSVQVTPTTVSVSAVAVMKK